MFLAVAWFITSVMSRVSRGVVGTESLFFSCE